MFRLHSVGYCDVGKQSVTRLTDAMHVYAMHTQMLLFASWSFPTTGE